MPAEPRLLEAPEVLWRVERATATLRFSRISPVDAENDRAGNRFDVPGGGVLYAATEPSGADPINNTDPAGLLTLNRSFVCQLLVDATGALHGWAWGELVVLAGASAGVGFAVGVVGFATFFLISQEC